MAEANEVMVYKANEELSIANDELILMANQAPERVAAVNTIMRASIQVTTPKDWVIIGGNPYLQESGATKIANLFNVNWKLTSSEKKYDEDGSGHYAYHWMGTFTRGGTSIDASGMRSTKDEFFIGSANNPNKPQLKPSDVDERDVKNAAMSNCIVNGIKRSIPGLRNVSVEYLQSAGLDTSKCSGYGFNTGAAKEMTGEALNQRDEIKRMLVEMYGDAKWTQGLEKATENTDASGKFWPGKKDISKLTEKQIPFIYKKVSDGYNDWKAKKQKKTASKKEEQPVEQPTEQSAEIQMEQPVIETVMAQTAFDDAEDPAFLKD